jgi:hypothetical protein
MSFYGCVPENVTLFKTSSETHTWFLSHFILGLALFQTLRIKWDLLIYFQIALFHILVKCDRTIHTVYIYIIPHCLHETNRTGNCFEYRPMTCKMNHTKEGVYNKTCDSNCGDNEECCPLVCDTVQSGWSSVTFRSNVCPHIQNRSVIQASSTLLLAAALPSDYTEWMGELANCGQQIVLNATDTLKLSADRYTIYYGYLRTFPSSSYARRADTFNRLEAKFGFAFHLLFRQRKYTIRFRRIHHRVSWLSLSVFLS